MTEKTVQFESLIFSDPDCKKWPSWRYPRECGQWETQGKFVTVEYCEMLHEELHQQPVSSTGATWCFRSDTSVTEYLNWRTFIHSFIHSFLIFHNDPFPYLPTWLLLTAEGPCLIEEVVREGIRALLFANIIHLPHVPHTLVKVLIPPERETESREKMNTLLVQGPPP